MINGTIVSNDINYELKIISQDEISKGKTLKQYNINGEKIVGCYENEPFLIEFKNKTWNKIQVKISLDGTDIITGNLADTSEVGEMWVVQPYGTLTLKAFPETNKGGAEFVFGKTQDSVAVNTHGVKSGIGYIATAIFVEDVQPSWTWHNTYGSGQIQHNPDITWQYVGTTIYPNTLGGSGITFNSGGTMGVNKGVDNVAVYSANAANVFSASVASMDSCEISEASFGPAVGAGEYVAQEITKVAGLSKPVLATTISIKYEWWTSLRSKIRKMRDVPVNPAFPGDHNVTKMIDLKSTPRKKKNKKEAVEVKYPELNRFG